MPGQHRDAVRVRKDVHLKILAGADPISVTSSRLLSFQDGLLLPQNFLKVTMRPPQRQTSKLRILVNKNAFVVVATIMCGCGIVPRIRRTRPRTKKS